MHVFGLWEETGVPGQQATELLLFIFFNVIVNMFMSVITRVITNRFFYTKELTVVVFFFTQNSTISCNLPISFVQEMHNGE